MPPVVLLFLSLLVVVFCEGVCDFLPAFLLVDGSEGCRLRAWFR